MPEPLSALLMMIDPSEASSHNARCSDLLRLGFAFFCVLMILFFSGTSQFWLMLLGVARCSLV